MVSSVNSGNEVLDKKIEQWLEWDKVRLKGMLVEPFVVSFYSISTIGVYV